MRARQTPQQLEACLARLAAYYPVNWDEQRQAVWAQELAVIDYETATVAIAAMGRSEEFASVAKFLTYAGKHAKGNEPVTRGEHRWLPGSGWLGDGPQTPSGAVAELDEAPPPMSARESIAAARAALRGG